jgi:hypothetical protein
MSPKQEKIAVWLAERSSSLHGGYLVALQLLSDRAIPGRAQLICHVGRDLCKGLQDIRGASRGERADTTAVFREIEPVWEREGLDTPAMRTQPESDTAAEQALASHIQISSHLMILLRRLMQEYRKGKAIQESQADELFRADDPDVQQRPETILPLRRQWADLRQWFQRYAHFGARQRTPDEHELQAKFAVLEDCILGVIQTFYEGMEGLDDILDEANS